MKGKILLSMLAVMTSICMLTACGNSSNSVQDTKNTDATESESTVQYEEKQTAEETDADGTTLSGDRQEAAAEDVDVPSKETVLERRNACLQGMSEEDITRLTENIKVANLTMEYSFLYDRLFERMADPEDLYWNYVDQKGDIQIGYSLEQEAVDAWKEYSQNAEEITDMDSYWKAYQQYEEEHGQPVYTYNRFDADNFIALMEEMKGLLKNDTLTADLDQLIKNTRQAKETHDVTYIKEIYYILHDMDYYLLRYAPDDVASFVQDKGRIAVYYGALQVYG